MPRGYSGQNHRDVITYPLKDIDPGLWKKVKDRAASEGRSIRFVLLAFLKAYAEHGFSVVEQAIGKERR